MPSMAPQLWTLRPAGNDPSQPDAVLYKLERDRPGDEANAEIVANRQDPARQPDTRGAAEITADLKAYIAANPLSAEDLAYDRQLETERRRSLRARSDRKEARAKARRTQARAKAAATKQAAAERRQAEESRRVNARLRLTWALRGAR